MVEEVVLDSSVIIAAFVKGEAFRKIAVAVLRKVFSSEYVAVLSQIAPAEICGSIARRAGVKEARRVAGQLARWRNLGLTTYLDLDAKRSEQARELAIQFQLRGMDAIVVQAAVERKCRFITFDEEIAERVKDNLTVSTHKDMPDA